MNKKEITNKIAERAHQDESFKQELFSNPKAALAKEGINIPEDIEVSVFEETPTRLAFVLPMNPSRQELAEADLEAVSGGAGATTQGLDVSWD